MHCMNCGTELPNSARFCISCGTPVTADETPEVSSLAQQEETSQLTAGPSVVVEPGSLERAVREAQAGAILRLSAGEHHLSRPLEIDKPLSLIGEGMDNTGVLCDGEGYVVKFVGDGPFVLYDLTFAHYGSQWAHVVDIIGGEVDIRRCLFGGGVEEDEPGERGGNGLRLRGQTRGFVANCEAVENMYGISIEDQAQPTLEANLCQENRVVGIAYQGSSGGIAQQNTCAQNGFGITVSEQAQPTLEANTCQNGLIGISYTGSSNGIARQNVCSGNGQSGIQLDDQAQPTLEANTCQENQGSGILYKGAAAGTARQNVCNANEYQGIFVTDQAQPTLEANTCRENQAMGIGYLNNAAGIARQNVCSGNEGAGILVTDQAQPTLLSSA